MEKAPPTLGTEVLTDEKAATGLLDRELVENGEPASPATLPQCVLGKTGVQVPVFGCGGGGVISGGAPYFGHLEHNHEERVLLIRNAFDAGIRYFDNARGYHDSETIFGEALEDVGSRIYLATKVCATSASDARESVETSLKELRTDHVDCLQLHDMANEHGYDATLRLYEAVAKMRDEGLCRFIGLTGHGKHQIMHDLISQGLFDTLLIDYSYFPKAFMSRHSEETVRWRDRCIAKASELGVGLVAMKVLGANVFSHRAREHNPGHDDAYYRALARAALRWAYADNRFQVFTLGIGQAGDIVENIATFRHFPEFNDEDKQLLDEHIAVFRKTSFYQQLPIA